MVLLHETVGAAEDLLTQGAEAHYAIGLLSALPVLITVRVHDEGWASGTTVDHFDKMFLGLHWYVVGDNGLESRNGRKWREFVWVVKYGMRSMRLPTS